MLPTLRLSTVNSVTEGSTVAAFSHFSLSTSIFSMMYPVSSTPPVSVGGDHCRVTLRLVTSVT